MTTFVVTRDNAASLGSFSAHQKKTLTVISDFTVPAGISFETPEGLKAEDEECRIAFDVQGGVYPIRESVYQASYAKIEDSVTRDAIALLPEDAQKTARLLTDAEG